MNEFPVKVVGLHPEPVDPRYTSSRRQRNLSDYMEDDERALRHNLDDNKNYDDVMQKERDKNIFI